MKEQLQLDTMQRHNQRTCMAYRMRMVRAVSAKMHDNRLRPFYTERVPKHICRCDVNGVEKTQVIVPS